MAAQRKERRSRTSVQLEPQHGSFGDQQYTVGRQRDMAMRERQTIGQGDKPGSFRYFRRQICARNLIAGERDQALM